MKRRPGDTKIVSFDELERRRKAKGKAPHGKPRPRKLYNEFSLLLVTVRKRSASGTDETETVEAANLPFNGDGYELFLAIAARDPDGWFRAYDGTPIGFRDVVAVPDPRNPERRSFSLPEAGTGAVPEIRVKLCDSRDVVAIWNLPDDEQGRSLYDGLSEVHPDCDVMTSDFGYVPLNLMTRL